MSAIPSTVRYGLGLLAASLVVGVAAMAGPGKSPISALMALLVFGAVLFNGARRQNWARIVLIVFVAIGIAFNAMLLPIQLDQDRVVAASTVVQCLLQSVGVILLLRQSSVRWYHATSQAAAD